MTAPVQRPLSPHLQIYKKQLTSATSIIHRLTGVALTAGMPVLAIWLMAVARGGTCYDSVMSLLTSCVGQICLFGWTWCLFFHFCNGIRHLLWDAGKTLDIKSAYLTGYIAIATSLVLTALVWLNAYGIIP
jgi:succinate dehydrogenase / fumarate reductase cytochrome b subunit